MSSWQEPCRLPLESVGALHNIQGNQEFPYVLRTSRAVYDFYLAAKRREIDLIR